MIEERKAYMRDVYSKYWITAREKIYGFLDYDKNLCHYINEHVSRGGSLLEVAIGTGFPFADFFQKWGYSVYGVDISRDLIEKCRQLNSNINCSVGDAEDLPYQDDLFECTYCFHSTWYFPNLNKVIDEMLRVTHSGGLVIFDIQNRNNKDINSAYRKRLSPDTGMKRVLRYTKNIAKVFLHYGMPVWHSFVHEVPTYPEVIYKHFRDRQVTNFQVMVKKEDESIEIRNELDKFKDFGRLVFLVRK